jgi:heme/copper-type cytochrome/quinol oxidase subunit 2
MRVIALEVLATVAALTFLGTLVAIAVHRSANGPQDPWRGSALAEYLWAMVPWLMVAACVLPSVRRIVASG